jgi:hypothetical protein
MSVQREELLQLDVVRHLRAARGQAWPPEWCGAGESQATDVAARSEDLLNEGFNHSA